MEIIRWRVEKGATARAGSEAKVNKWAKPDIELSLKDGGLVTWSYGYRTS